MVASRYCQHITLWRVVNPMGEQVADDSRGAMVLAATVFDRMMTCGLRYLGLLRVIFA